MLLLKDTTQWRRWGSNPRSLGLGRSPSVSSQALYHWATALPGQTSIKWLFLSLKIVFILAIGADPDDLFFYSLRPINNLSVM